MRAFALALPLALAGCGAATVGTIISASGLDAADLVCIGSEVMDMPRGTPPVYAAQEIAAACGITVAGVDFSGDDVVVEAEGETVAVDEAANTVAVVD
jgi:hypothetical protein